MKRTLLAVLSAVLLYAPAAQAEQYSVVDEGGFGSTGRFIEFASRYGWQSYKIRYDFGVDMGERKLSKRSTLDLTIVRNDGSEWSYRCRARDQREMWANINKLYGKGVSILTECRISPKQFAKSVRLDKDLVGEPTLVFHVMISDGKAVAGLQKGFYFLAGGQIEAGAMNHYASQHDDPSNLGVLFASAMKPYLHHPGYAATPRFLP